MGDLLPAFKIKKIKKSPGNVIQVVVRYKTSCQSDTLDSSVQRNVWIHSSGLAMTKIYSHY